MASLLTHFSLAFLTKKMMMKDLLLKSFVFVVVMEETWKKNRKDENSSGKEMQKEILKSIRNLKNRINDENASSIDH